MWVAASDYLDISCPCGRFQHCACYRWGDRGPLRILLKVKQSVWGCGGLDQVPLGQQKVQQRMKNKNHKSPLSTSEHALGNPSLTLGLPSLYQATDSCYLPVSKNAFSQNLTFIPFPIQSPSIYSPTFSSPPAMSKQATLRTLLLSTGNSKVPIT